jgi:hypothetical protein
MSSGAAQVMVAVLLMAVMAAGLGVAWLAVHGRQRIRELAYQERIAMIEKGLVPSPETDPAGFEAMMSPRRTSVKAIRYRTSGVILTGFGLAFTVLMFFVVPDIRGIALGVGGAFTVFGLTILANGLLLASDDVEGSWRNIGKRG